MFRPCIDLHEGLVKQIVGGTLSDLDSSPQTNFVADRPSEWFAKLYQKDALTGGHVIKLGPGNEEAAYTALAAYPGGLQIGGGVNLDNAKTWLDAGASHVVITSWVFRDGQIHLRRIKDLVAAIGKERLVLDLSCRIRDGRYFVVTDRWKNFTTTVVSEETLDELSQFCDEYLIHAVDVEGLCQGIDLELVEKLAEWSPIPTTYAGGAKSMDDLRSVHEKGNGRIHLTIGSALDIFGGDGVRYEDAVTFNRENMEP